MRRAISAAVALAGLVACWGNSPHGVLDLPPDSGIPPGLGTGDGGDAGPDGGDGGSDAGSDAGCVPLTLSGTNTIDCCVGGSSASATGTVNIANCSITISLNTATGPCAGAVSGPSNAFDGGCEGGYYQCTSPSLPGTMTCVSGTTTCAIKIGDAGTSCP